MINAAGVWTDEIQQMVGGRGQFRVRASKGVHIVIPRNRINSATGIIARTAASVLFIVPWGSHWIIGTTDTDWNLDLAHPAASQQDIDYLLDQANRLLADPLTREDVVGVYAGLRPLLAGESDSTSTLSREHAVASPVRGLTVIAGGKYTTYRVMAKDAVDFAVHDMDRKVPESITENVPLLGADGYHGLWNSRRNLASRIGLRVHVVEHLLGRYGSLMDELIELIEQRPELGGAACRAPRSTSRSRRSTPPRTRARVTWRTSSPAAPASRSRCPTAASRAAEAVAALIAPVLGWDDDDVARELEHYRQRVAAEQESQHQTDDLTADAARLGAPDVRLGASARS